MKGIVIDTQNRMAVRDFREPLHRSLGDAVGGWFEVVHPKGLPEPYVMIVNEEGLLQQLPVNLTGSTLYGTAEHGNPIVGRIVIMKEGYRNGEPDIVGLDKADIVALKALLGKVAPVWE